MADRRVYAQATPRISGRNTKGGRDSPRAALFHLHQFEENLKRSATFRKRYPISPMALKS